MNLQQFITTEFGTRLWMSLGRSLPPSAGHTLARIVAGIVSRRRHASHLPHPVRQSGRRARADTAPEILHRAVGDVLQHVGMTAYDLMHTVAQGEAAIRAAVTFEDDFWTWTNAAKAANRGVMICGCHTSAFNLAFLAWSTYDDVPRRAGALAAGTGRRLQGDARAACTAEGPGHADRRPGAAQRRLP